MAAIGKGADGEAVNGALVRREFLSVSARDCFAALLKNVVTLAIPRIVGDRTFHHVFPVSLSGLSLIVFQFFLVFPLRFESQSKVDTVGGAGEIVLVFVLAH